MIKKLLALTLVLALTGGSATAAYYSLSEKNELADLFCNDLKKDDIYEKNNLENYTHLIPGRGGWIFRTQNDFRSQWHVNDKTTGYLMALQDAFKRKNADLIIVMPPVRGLVHAENLFRKEKKAYGLEDPTIIWNNYDASIKELQGKGINIVGIDRNEVTPDFFYSRDHHWSADGARITARKTAEAIKRFPSYAAIEKISFETTEKQPVPYKSSFDKAFRKICKTHLPPETVKLFVTAPKEAAIDQNTLFDDGKSPQVVLLGTSNSVPETSQANFDGFLREYLSTDILNVSYIGAGIDTSIMSYLNSDHFNNQDRKIVIWEVPGYYDLNIMDDKLFNQIIPAAYGSCSQNPVYASQVGNIKQGTNLLLDFSKENPQPPAEALPGGESEIERIGAMSQIPYSLENVKKSTDVLYMHLRFSKPVKDKFALLFQYEGSGMKRQQFDRSDRYPHDPDFYTLLPIDEKNEKLQGVSMTDPSPMEGMGVHIEVCAMPRKTDQRGSADLHDDQL